MASTVIAEVLAGLILTPLMVPGVAGVHEIRAESVGPDLAHVRMDLEVAGGTALEEMDRIDEEVRSRVHDQMDTGYCVIQIEAAGSPAAHETTDERVDSLVP